MSFDLEQLEMIDRAVYQVTDARGDDVIIDGMPFTLTIASPGTKKATQAQFKRDEARTARIVGAANGVKSKRTVEDELRERADFLMLVTESTSHPGVSYKGKVGTEALRAMFMEPKVGYIAAGAEAFHKDMGNFSADLPTASSSTSAIQPG